MKIVIISHTYVSAINRDKWKTLALDYPQCSLTVVIPEQWPTHFFAVKTVASTQENTKNCTFIPMKTFGAGNELRYCYHPIKLIRLLRQIKPDVIHVEQGASALCYLQTIISSWIARIKPAFCFFTWVNWQHPSYGRLHFLWRWIEQFNIRHSSGAIAGNNDAQTILQHNGMHKPIIVLPQLGVDPRIFKPAHKDTNSKIIVYIGRLVEEKGVMDLLKVFTKIHTQFPEWKLMFVGSGAVEKRLIDFVITKKLLDHVVFKPPVAHDKIPSLLQQAALLVLPSLDTQTWREQFGHVIIEAMACKVPVLGSSAGEIPFVIGQAGAIFKQGDCTDLERQLTNLMHSSSLRNKLGEDGLHHVTEHYTHHVIGKKTYTFWQELVRTNILHEKHTNSK